jgi:hypothetical protein
MLPIYYNVLHALYRYHNPTVCCLKKIDYKCLVGTLPVPTGYNSVGSYYFKIWWILSDLPPTRYLKK